MDTSSGISILALAEWLLAPINSFFTESTHLFYWPYLIGSTVIALLYFYYNKTRYSFSLTREKKVELAKDVGWLTINVCILGAVLGPLTAWFDNQLLAAEQTSTAYAAPKEAGNFVVTVLYTCLLALLFDFSYFIAHYCFHKSGLLWKLHRVHHAATQLTPLTVLRQHPFELVLSGVFITLSLNCLDHFLSTRLPIYVYELQANNINVILFIFFISGYHLRHSNLAIRYPAVVEQHLISPAMHQLHHSRATCHMNKNFGLIFSYWDRLFGTFIPSPNTTLTFGIAD